ncbi:MAG: hydroxyacylglutathione hydrolase [Burkholderia gladioli]
MARQLDYTPVPFGDDNHAWVISDDACAIVVDPGQAEPVVAFCRSRGLVVSAVLVTHHHGDHTGGVAALLDACGRKQAPVYGPSLAPIACVTRHVGAGCVVEVAAPAFSASVMATPGHTNDHLCFYQAGRAGQPGHLFSGDTLFASGCGRLLEGTGEEMLASLDAIARLPRSTLVHCAHEYTLSNIRFSRVCEPGNRHTERWMAEATQLRLAGRPTIPTTIGHELRVNPFLRAHRHDIHDLLIERFGVPVPNRLAAFVLLRAWKDVFQDEYRAITEKWAPGLLHHGEIRRSQV